MGKNASTYTKAASLAVDLAMKSGALHVTHQNAEKLVKLISKQLEITVELMEMAGKSVSKYKLITTLADKGWSIGSMAINEKNKCAIAVISLGLTVGSACAEEAITMGAATIIAAADLLNSSYEVYVACGPEVRDQIERIAPWLQRGVESHFM